MLKFLTTGQELISYLSLVLSCLLRYCRLLWTGWKHLCKPLFTCLIGNLIVCTRNAIKAADSLPLLGSFPESRPTALTAHRLRNLREMKAISKPGVVAHAFNPSTWKAETGRFLSSRPSWSKKWVPGQSELYRETLSWKIKKKKDTIKFLGFSE